MSSAQESPRPHKRAEFVIEFATRSAQKGWRDCLAVARNATVDAWNRLTTAPMLENERRYQLKADARGAIQIKRADVASKVIDRAADGASR